MTIDTLPYPHDLGDGVVSLRVHRPTDAEALAAAVRESVATVGRWQDWCHEGYGTADADTWMDICRKDWLLGDGYEMLIVDARTDVILGGMGVNQRNREQRFANLGYWVRESMQGRGIATRAGRLAIRFAFGTAKVARLEIVAAWDNLPSRKTAERLGGIFEGRLRKRLVVKETSVDAAMYSLIADDLPESSASRSAHPL
ncbi:GNAT family N-acetyltransferase [Luteibacter yeojuensis]